MNQIGGGAPAGAPVSPITGKPRSAWSQQLHQALMNWVPGQTPHPLAQGGGYTMGTNPLSLTQTPPPPPPSWNPYENVMAGQPAGYPSAFDQNGMIPNMPMPQAPQMPANPAQNMAPVSQANPANPPVPAGSAGGGMSQMPQMPQMPQMQDDRWKNIPGAMQMPDGSIRGDWPTKDPWGRPLYPGGSGQPWPQDMFGRLDYKNRSPMTAGKYLDQLVNGLPLRT